MHVRIEALQGLVETHLAGGGEIDIPAHQLVVAVDPAAPVEVAVALELDGAESLDEAARDCLLADARTLENLRDDAQHLARIDRLDEVVADVGADGLLERRVLLALGDHHDRKVGGELADVAVGLEPRFSGHLLVEQHDVERAAAEHLDRVVGVTRPFHLVALGAQEDAVRLEKLTFVVHPEDGFCWRWHGFCECSRGSYECLDSSV